jgi:nucleoside 2-deoxyribosyltransferase
MARLTMRIASVFLSGPDQWLPDAGELLTRKRALCEAAGFVAITGLDGERREKDASEAMAREVYAGALANLRQADAVIANLSPWRGPNCDPGCAFEVGFASALGKPVFAYMNVTDEDDADYRMRVEAMLGAVPDDLGGWRDPEGARVEDFGLPENLMLWAESRRFYVVVTADPQDDITGLELCLEAMRLYAD